MSNIILSTVFALLSCYASYAKADPLPATTTPTSTTTGGFPVITDTENTGALNGGLNGGSSTHDSSNAGASGQDSGFQLSTGAIIGIAIAIAVIIIAFIILWALWFTAKRRNWAVRDTLKYASRRFTGRGAVPPTPKTPRTPHPARQAPPSRRGEDAYGGRDVERGQPKKSAMKPHAGWLEEEKEISRSNTPQSRR